MCCMRVTGIFGNYGRHLIPVIMCAVRCSSNLDEDVAGLTMEPSPLWLLGQTHYSNVAGLHIVHYVSETHADTSAAG